MWTYYFLHSGTNQLIKGVTVCPQAYCNMGSAFMAIVTQAHSIEMKQLSSPFKKIRFLCDALVAKAGKLSDEAASLVGFMHCRSGESKPISNWKFAVSFVVCAALSCKSTSALQMHVTPTQIPLKGVLWNCPVDAFLPFWKRLKYSWTRIQAVAIDMSSAYVSTIFKNLPKATIVFDHFHLIKLSNEKLSDFRRDLHHQATKEGKDVLKGLHRLLLKNPGNLKPQHNEKQRLEQLLLLNSSLATAYYLKEDLRQLWFQKNKKQASVHLDDWIARAKSSGIKMLLTFSETLEKHRDGILTYFDLPISTRPLEGKNNKIKILQKQIYGFCDMSFFKLKILGLH